MNKQPSKESLKDKLKGVFGLTPRISAKQTESKPSEFIITHDILKVGEVLIFMGNGYCEGEGKLCNICMCGLGACSGVWAE